MKEKKMARIWHDFTGEKMRVRLFRDSLTPQMCCDICGWPRSLHQNHPDLRPPTPRERVRRAHAELKLTALEYVLWLEVQPWSAMHLRLLDAPVLAPITADVTDFDEYTPDQVAVAESELRRKYPQWAAACAAEQERKVKEKDEEEREARRLRDYHSTKGALDRAQANIWDDPEEL